MKRYIILCITTFCLFLCANKANGQNIEFPEFPDENQDNIVVTVDAQGLDFGSVTLRDRTSNGSVKVTTSDIRIAGGDVVLLGGAGGHSASLSFKMPPNRVVRITYPPTVDMLGSNGGLLVLTINEVTVDGVPLVNSSFESKPDYSESIVKIGGELQINPISSNPAGEYTGLINIDYVLE